MANSATKGYTFGATELVTNAKLHSLVDSATITVDTVSANSLTVGDGAAGNKLIYANNGDANLPNLRFNDTSNKWEYSNDGTTWSEMGTGGASITALYGASFTALASVNVAAGLIPPANVAQSLASGNYAYYDGSVLKGNAVNLPTALYGASFTALASIPLAAGLIPNANVAQSLASGNYAYYNGTVLSGAVINLPTALYGASFTALGSVASGAGRFPPINLVQSLASGNYAYYDGSVLRGNTVTATGGSSGAVYGTFNYGSLVSGVCSVAHLVSLASPFFLDVELCGYSLASGASVPNIQKVLPDNINYGSGAFSINMFSYLAGSNATVFYGYTYHS